MNGRRQDFPLILKSDLIYLDSAASSQKPHSVIDAIAHCYHNDYANVKRGIYDLSERTSKQFEGVRDKVRRFIHAKTTQEIIFTRGTTESINLVAQCYGQTHLTAGDEIILSYMEHHANIVPWKMLADKTNAVIKVIPLTDKGELDLEVYEQLLSSRTKIVALAHVSNVLGTVNPIKEISRLAHLHDAVVLVDGAQAIAHRDVDVQALDCDFYAFSSHKMYGPAGIGILYGKQALLEKMPPYQTGGDMIKSVRFDKIIFNDLPFRFEAGTPNIEGVIGLGAALDYLSQFTFDALQAHEKLLLAAATDALKNMNGIRIYGESENKHGIIAFAHKDVHPHDIATILNQSKIAVRAGHHCAQPLMEFYKVPALTRASFGIYNTLEDVNALIAGMHQVNSIFGI